MRLEDLRGPRVGDVALIIPGLPLRAAAFHDHANQAHWHTLNCLLRLAGNPVDGVADEAIGVVEWWRTIESLVALLHAVADEESNASLRGERRLTSTDRDQILDRWRSLALWFSEGRQSPPSEITGRLTELRDFRNSFEHSSRQSTITIRHSRLTPEPATANVADLVEAMAICIEACDFVRYTLAGCDVMPDVVVPSRQHVFFEKIDVSASDVVLPLYHEIVAALGLSSDIDLYPVARRLQGTSVVQARLAIKALPNGADVQLEPVMNLWDRFEAYAANHARRPAPEEFRLPNYDR